MTHEGQRKPNPFSTVAKVMEVAEHTFLITDNPNKFKDYVVKEKKNEDGTVSKVYIWRNDSLTNRVRDLANEIYVLAWTANEIDLRRQPERKMERLSKQVEAISKCDVLLAEIQLCRKHFHLNHKKIMYWGKLVRDARIALEGWHESDKDRYKDI